VEPGTLLNRVPWNSAVGTAVRAARTAFVQRVVEPPRSVGLDHSLDVRRLVQVLAGDLDWVVMKAIRKDRNERYSSAAAFSDSVSAGRGFGPGRGPSTMLRMVPLPRRKRRGRS